MTASFPIASIPIANAATVVAGLNPVIPVPVSVRPSYCFGLTTVGDIIQRALKAILVEGADGGLQPDEYQDGLDALNDYMAALEVQGIQLGYSRACGLSDTATIPNGAIRGVVANLAIELAPQFSGRVSAALIKQAAEGMIAMQSLGVNVGETTYPTTLPAGSGNYNHHDSNIFTLNISPFVVMTMADNRRPTDITVISGAEKIAGFWTLNKFRNFQPDISGRIVNTGNRIDVRIDASFVMVGDASIATGFVGVVQNGDIVLYAETALTTSPLAVPITGILTLDPGDYLEFYVANRTDTVNITVTDAIVRLN